MRKLKKSLKFPLKIEKQHTFASITAYIQTQSVPTNGHAILFQIWSNVTCPCLTISNIHVLELETIKCLTEIICTVVLEFSPLLLF